MCGRNGRAPDLRRFERHNERVHCLSAVEGLRKPAGFLCVRIPDDVGVMSLEGAHDGQRSDRVPLTSVTVPGNRMGEEAIRLVLDEARPGHRHERLTLPVTLRQGRST